MWGHVNHRCSFEGHVEELDVGGDGQRTVSYVSDLSSSCQVNVVPLAS
jgi:hypothetical protein